MKQLLLLGAFLITFFKGHTQTTFRDSILHESEYRSYLIHLPPGFDAGQSLPLVLVFHGSNGNANQVMSYTGFNAVADTGNFIVVYPEGHKKSWADGRGFSIADTAGIDDVSFISSLTDTLLLKYNINNDHIYAAGIYHGGFMTQWLACQMPHRIAAVASVIYPGSDRPISLCNNRHPVPALYIQETFDSYAPLNKDIQIIPLENNLFVYENGLNSDSTINAKKQNGTISDITVDLPYLNPIEKVEIVSTRYSAAAIWNFFKNRPLKTVIRFNSLDQVKTNHSLDFTSFPNPVQGSLFLSYTNGSIDHVEIFDHDSKSVLSLSGNDIAYPIDVSTLPSGLYMIKVRTGDGETIKNIMVKD